VWKFGCDPLPNKPYRNWTTGDIETFKLQQGAWKKLKNQATELIRKIYLSLRMNDSLEDSKN